MEEQTKKVFERIKSHVEEKIEIDSKILDGLLPTDDSYYLGKVNAENEVLGYLESLEKVLYHEKKYGK